MIQQRSPVYKSLNSSYICALIDWITTSHFKEVLWLTSIDAAARTDDEFCTPILSLLPANSTPSTRILASLQTSFPQFNPPSIQSLQIPTKTHIDVPHIPGSLLTRKLLHHISHSSVKDSFGALLYFAAEGDTRPDAHNLATLVVSLLSTTTTPQLLLKEPRSWSALFGRPAASALYA